MRVNMSMYFIDLYENRTKKPAEIVLNGGGKKMREMIVGMNLTKSHYKHI
jgi:hypothetical protein